MILPGASLVCIKAGESTPARIRGFPVGEVPPDPIRTPQDRFRAHWAIRLEE
jgi:hypothetical protein